ncbi:MAG: LysR family transcriptional regulator [Polaromonas sp.]|uniref:LysR family transcriptional regulator n=1 Tax=Polaromonas sp. TaxID=1869339 RepID=UPI0027361C1B|nr:LysR family transcriptional regulator [Polaromonas sp.]MDP3799034.1 LysR family transcriptional regulator [Polaromonas sp.]
MSINWNAHELDVFLALAETLSFRRTAEQVHLSQPAVSGLISRLEESLGVRLFDRTTRSVQLTGPGQVFVEQARLLRQQSDEAVRAVRNVAELQVGQVVLAALPSLAATVVPAAFARFALQFPAVRLQVVDTLSGPAFDLVRAGQVEFALTAANPAYADLDYTPLASDGFVLLIPVSHPLASGSKPLRWVEVATLTHISMPLPSSVRQYADAALLEHRVRFSPRYEVEHLATINAMVAAGLGVAALPELAAAVAPQAGLVQRRLVDPDIPRPIGLVTRRGRSLSPASAAMVEFLRQEVQRLVPHRNTVPATRPNARKSPPSRVNPRQP